MQQITLNGRFCYQFCLAILSGVIFPPTVIAEKVWVPGWKAASTLTVPRAGSALVAHKNKIYVIGGVDGRTFLSSVEMATSNPDGTLSEWKIISSMPVSRGFTSATVFNSRLYVLGGGNGAYGKNLLKSIASAPISNNGMLGEWRIEAEQMLLPRRCSKLFVHNDSIFTVGGFGGTLLDSVEAAKFSQSGELGEWTLHENTLMRPRYVNSVTKADDYVFVIGGHHESKGIGIKSVEFTSLSKEPLIWKNTHSLKQGRYAFSSTANKKQIYALGGISGSEYLDSVERLDISQGIESANWQSTTKLPKKMANFNSIVVNNNLYVIGGSTRQTYLTSVWHSSFDANGDIGFWGSQYQRAEAFESTKSSDDESVLRNSGKIIDRIETDSYSYLLVDTGSKLLWLAAPINNISINSRIRFSEGVFMSNFYSKSLKRNFDAILFVGTVRAEQ